MGKPGAPPLSLKELEKRWTKKFGKDFIKDLAALKTQPFLTLDSLAIRYNVTRQSIDQKFRRYFDNSYSVYKKRRMQQMKEEVTKIGCRINSFILDYNETSQIAVHARAEKRLIQKCQEQNLIVEVLPLCGAYHYFIINKFNVRLFAANSKPIGSIKSKAKYYRFSHPRSISVIKLNFDFLIFYVEPLNKFYIVPYDYNNTSTNFYVPALTNILTTYQIERRELFLETWGQFIRSNDERGA